MNEMFKRTPVDLIKKSEYDEQGISVKDALQLIEKSDYKEHIKNAFKIDNFTNDFINIKGAKRLVDDLTRKTNEFEKIDIKSLLSDVSIHSYNDDEEDSINICINNTNKEGNPTPIVAKTIYSAKSTFFDEMFSMSKFSKARH